MSKYYAAYKCQLCGAVLQYGDAHEVPYNGLPDLLGKVIKNQQFVGNPYLHEAPMQLPHQCKDGSCGMAYFIGFKICNETTHSTQNNK